MLTKLAHIAKSAEKHPDQLKALAVLASEAYLKGNASTLNAALDTSLKEEDLTPEQVRRVVEMANQHTFSQKFEGASDRTFEFPLAEADRFTPKKEEPRPREGFSDTWLPPANLGVGKTPTTSLEEAFGQPVDRGEPSHDPLRPAVEMSGHLEGAADRMELKAAVDHRAWAEAASGFVHEAKQAVLGGEKLASVMGVVGAVATDEKTAAAAGKLLAQIDYGVRHPQHMEKVASEVPKLHPELVEKDHPVVQAYLAMEKAASDLRLHLRARESLRSRQDLVRSFLRDKVRGQ